MLMVEMMRLRKARPIRFSHDPRLDSFRGSALEWEWNYLREKYGYIDLDKIGGYWYASKWKH